MLLDATKDTTPKVNGVNAKLDILLNVFMSQVSTLQGVNYSAPEFKNEPEDIISTAFHGILMLLSFMSVFVVLTTFMTSKGKIKTFVPTLLIMLTYFCLFLTGMFGVIEELFTMKVSESQVHEAISIILLTIALFLRLIASIPLSLNVPTLFMPVIYLFWLDKSKLNSFSPVNFGIYYSLFMHIFAALFKGFGRYALYIIADIAYVPFLFVAVCMM